METELPVEEEDVISALNCSIEVLANVAGKEQYSSLDRVCDLLACSNCRIVNRALVLLETVYQRSMGVYQSVPPDLPYFLEAIAAPSSGPSLLNIVEGKLPMKKRGASRLEFAVEPNPVEEVDERPEEEKLSNYNQRRSFKVGKRTDLPADDFKALRYLIHEHGPIRGRRQRFRLLTEIRAWSLFDCAGKDRLELEAKNRLLAGSVLVPVCIGGELWGKTHDALKKMDLDEVFKKTFGEECSVPEAILPEVLTALANKYVGSDRSTYKMGLIENILKGGEFSPFGRFLQTRSERVLGSCSELDVRILEATLHAAAMLCNMRFFCEELIDAQFFESILPLIGDQSGYCRRSIVASCLLAVEAMFSGTSAGAEKFAACNGPEVLEQRLEFEISKAKAESSIAYGQKFLVKKLLKTMTKVIMTSDTSGIEEKRVQILYSAIKEIFESHELFESGVFDSACTCFRELLNHDPLQYKTMSSFGLDVTYLDAVSSMKGRDGDVTLNIIPTLSAMCLNETGRALVKSRKAVQYIADTFLDVRALCLLPTSQSIGRALEEMVRHHETMLGEVVESMVLAVDIVRKIASTGEIEVLLEERLAKDLPTFVSIAISRLSEVINPVCEVNEAAATQFFEQGGLQLYMDLVQPSFAIDCFCCTRAASSTGNFFKNLILLENKRDYVLEILMKEARVSLTEANALFDELEKQRYYNEDFCISKCTDHDLGPLMRSISKSTILIGSFAPLPFMNTNNKSMKICIDKGLCILPDLEKVLSRVIRLLTVSDEWRLQMDMELKAIVKDSLEEKQLKTSDLDVEKKRDTLNLFFRASCHLCNIFGRISEGSILIWENNQTEADKAARTIALLSADLITNSFSYLLKFENQRDFKHGRRQRHMIRLCRILTALVFDHRKKSVHIYTMNAMFRFGLLDFFLGELVNVSRVALEAVQNEGNVFIPTLKELKEQERQFETTGIGRSPLCKEIEADEWIRRSLIISNQHALLSMLGFLEIITSKDAYKGSESRSKVLDPHLFSLPDWIDSRNYKPVSTADITGPICWHVWNCLEDISLANADGWSRSPLPLAKYVKVLLHCRKCLDKIQWPSEEEAFEALKLADHVSKVKDKCLKEDPELSTSVLYSAFRSLEDGYMPDAVESLLETRRKNRELSDSGVKWIFSEGEIKSLNEKEFKLLFDIGGISHSSKLLVDPMDALISLNIQATKGLSNIINSLALRYEEERHGNFVRESLDSMLSLVENLPVSSFPMSDILVQSFTGNLSELRLIVDRHLDKIEARITGMSEQALKEWVNLGKDKEISALLKLISSMLNTSSVLRKSKPFIEGFGQRLLKLLQLWRQAVHVSKRAKTRNLLRVPHWVDACLLCIMILGEESYRPKERIPTVQSNPADPKKDFISRVKAALPPLESGQVSILVEASEIAVECLKISYRFAEHLWRPLAKEEMESPKHYYDPSPKSSVAAILEFFTMATKNRKASDAIINKNGHNLILAIPECAHTTECDGFVALVLHQLIQDEQSLQAGMEASIKSTLMRRNRSLSERGVSLKQFSANFIALACRDAGCFCRAVDNVCTFSRIGNRVEVKLRSSSDRLEGGCTEQKMSDTEDGGAKNSGAQGAENSQADKKTPKKTSKKLPSPVMQIIDAIIGRLIYLASPAAVQKIILASQTKLDDKSAKKLSSERFLLSQQILCINMISEFLISSTHCVTAFLRRDADPLPDWVMNKQSLQTPQSKVSKKDKQSSKKSKNKEAKSIPTGSTKAAGVYEGSNLCFLIGFILRNQVSYHGHGEHVPMRTSLSKDACSLLIALAQKSLEGQRRICQEIQLILHSFAYPGQGNPSNYTDIRSLDKAGERRSISADLEGALILLATMVSVQGTSSSSDNQASYTKDLIERFLQGGMVSLLVDTINQLDLSDTSDERLKLLLSAIIRSIEKLTTVRATVKIADGMGEESDMGVPFEDLVAQLNERGWLLAHEEPLDASSGDNEDSMILEHEEDSGGGESSYYSSMDSEEDSEVWSYTESGDSIEDDSSDNPLVVEVGGTSDDDSMDDSMDDDMSDSDAEDEAVEEEDEEDMLLDMEYDFDDIFPVDGSSEWRRAPFFREGLPPFLARNMQRGPHSLLEPMADGASDDDAFLDGNEEGAEEYYSDEEYEEDGACPYGDDSIVSNHNFANTLVARFWIQEQDGERSNLQFNQDPLFGTAFISSRLLVPAFRPSRFNEDTEIPASIYHHPILTRPISGMVRESGRHSEMHGLLSNESSPSRYLGRWIPAHRHDHRGNSIFRSQPGLNRLPEQHLPSQIVEHFAALIEDPANIAQHDSSARDRRRDRIYRSLNALGDPITSEILNFDQNRANSPPIVRPRQRQRTTAEPGAGASTRRPTDDAIVVPTGTEAPLDNANENQHNDDSDDIEPIDPEFLAALPPDLQGEVIENHERERRARRISRAAASARERNRNTTTEMNGENYVAEMMSHIPEELQAEALAGMENSSNPQQDQIADEEDTGNQIELALRELIDNTYSVGTRPREIRVRNTRNALLENISNPIVNREWSRLIQPVAQHRASQLQSEFSTPDFDRISFDLQFERGRQSERLDKRNDVQSDSEPLLQENQIPQLLRLLKFGRWEGKLHLNRAIRHLTESKHTAQAIFRQIFCLLRCPLSNLETNTENLQATLTNLKHPMPSLLTDIHQYIVDTHGSSVVLKLLGLEEPDDDTGVPQSGILSSAVTRRLLELLRYCFNLVERGVNNVLEMDISSLYDLYKSMGIIHIDIMDTNHRSSVPALDVLLSLPLRHDISKCSLRSMSLEVVRTFLSHFEEMENSIQSKKKKIKEIRDKNTRGVEGTSDSPAIDTLEIEQLENEIKELEEKAIGPRKAIKVLNKDIIRNYVMMLTYPSLKESETDCVRMILHSITSVNSDCWEIIGSAAAEFIERLSLTAMTELQDLTNGANLATKILRPESKGLGIFRCLQAVAEGIFQLVVDCFDPNPPSLPAEAERVRSIAGKVLEKMLERTKTTLWGPFNIAAKAIEQELQKQENVTGKHLPLSVKMIRPYVESYFLIHDTLRCSSCSLEVLAREINELTEEEQAWTIKREEVSKAAQEQTVASFTRIQSIDVMAGSQKSEKAEGSRSPDKSQVVCLPSSDSNFSRFAENHRKLINLIVSNDPTVLDGSMNMLLKYPKLLDFENKRVHFRKRIQTLARQLAHHSRLSLNVRRAHVFEDSFNQLRVVSKSQMRSPLKVTFSGEEGVDVGGLTREWYQVMSREMFNPGISLFEAVPQGSSTYQPNPNSIVQTDQARGISHLDYFKFVGHVVGKALLDNQIIDAHFTRSFYKHMLGQPLTYRDIEGVDPDFFKNLSWMLENDIDGVLDLTFSEESDFFGQKSVVELCPNGANTKVTDQNKRDYVDAVARHRMTNAIQPQIHAFLDGFWNVVPRISISLFNDHELELMISGLPDVDVLDLRANCEYHGGYSASSQVILWFWEIALAMDREQKALLLQFVTGTSKVPVGGFSELQAISGRQKFQIHKAYGDEDRLPTAHTCFNQLDLPEYSSKDRLKERLLIAIHEGKEGFGFA